MAIESSDLVGGGEFIPTFTSGTTILNSGASGNIITLTPPAGERVRLTALSTLGAVQEADITVQVAGVDAVTSKELGGSNLSVANRFIISNVGDPDIGTADLAGVFPPITGKTDVVITVVKDSGSTIQALNYGFQFGK